MTKPSSKPPAHLSKLAATWWLSVASEYDMESHQFQLLTLAAEALDRGEEARKQLAADGSVVQGRFGPRAHPSVAIERDARVGFARILRDLHLEGDQPAGRTPASLVRMPPRPGSFRRASP